MPRKPSLRDRRIVSHHLYADAVMMRSHAEHYREQAAAEERPDVAETLVRAAALDEARAERFERLADWMVEP